MNDKTKPKPNLLPPGTIIGGEFDRLPNNNPENSRIEIILTI